MRSDQIQVTFQCFHASSSNFLPDRDIEKLNSFARSFPPASCVTCTIAADNYVTSVKLIHENGKVEELDIHHEGGTRWQDKKSVTFHQYSIDEQGALLIHAEDSYSDPDHCKSAGLIVHCTSSDPESQWDNFQTNTDDWYSEDRKTLCSDSDAAFLSYNVDWIRELTANGAKHLWVEGNQVVTLVGSPWNDFTLGTGIKA